jgi:hypothetical protein
VVQTPEQRAEYGRQWRAANREKVVAYARKWRAANPERVREVLRNQAARRRALRPVSQPEPEPAYTVAELAYAAGMLDGEGNLHFTIWKDSYMPLITITNTDQRLMDWLIAHFGGRVHIRRRHDPRHKSALDWRLHGKHAAAFARVVLPYLVLKREQAALLISYYDQGTFHWGSRPLPDDVRERRRLMHEAMKMLNHRGEQPSLNTL